jgi:phytoene dehydrogenase-like protein
MTRSDPRLRLEITRSMQAYDVVIRCRSQWADLRRHRHGGLKVKVLERRPIVGGAAVTEEFVRVRNSVAATVSSLSPKVIADLRLPDHGLRLVERRAQNFLPTPDGRYLLAAEGHTERNIANVSQADAQRYAAFNRELDASADCCASLRSRRRRI